MTNNNVFKSILVCADYAFSVSHCETSFSLNSLERVGERYGTLLQAKAVDYKAVTNYFCCATSVDLRAILGEVPLSADNKTRIIPWCRMLIICRTCVD